MWPNSQFTFTEEILNGKLHFLWSDLSLFLVTWANNFFNHKFNKARVRIKYIFIKKVMSLNANFHEKSCMLHHEICVSCPASIKAFFPEVFVKNSRFCISQNYYNFNGSSDSRFSLQMKHLHFKVLKVLCERVFIVGGITLFVNVLLVPLSSWDSTSMERSLKRDGNIHYWLYKLEDMTKFSKKLFRWNWKSFWLNPAGNQKPKDESYWKTKKANCRSSNTWNFTKRGIQSISINNALKLANISLTLALPIVFHK